jgi:hypothetical protein
MSQAAAAAAAQAKLDAAARRRGEWMDAKKAEFAETLDQETAVCSATRARTLRFADCIDRTDWLTPQLHTA